MISLDSQPRTTRAEHGLQVQAQAIAQAFMEVLETEALETAVLAPEATVPATEPIMSFILTAAI